MWTKYGSVFAILMLATAIETAAAAPQTKCDKLQDEAMSWLLVEAHADTRYLRIMGPIVAEFVKRKMEAGADVSALSREAHAKACVSLQQLNEQDASKAKKVLDDTKVAKCGSHVVQYVNKMMAQANNPPFYCKEGLVYRQDGQQSFGSP